MKWFESIGWDAETWVSLLVAGTVILQMMSWCQDRSFYGKLFFFLMCSPHSDLYRLWPLLPPYHHLITLSTKPTPIITPSAASRPVLLLSPLNTLQPCEPQVFYKATKLACPYSLASEPAEVANYICIALLIEVSNSNLIIFPYLWIAFHLSI